LEEKKKEKKPSIKGERLSYLSGFPFNPVKDGLEGRLAKATSKSRLLVVLIPMAQPLRTIVKSIPKRLVDALQAVPTSHKDLNSQSD
jgi:hypothetical protein